MTDNITQNKKCAVEDCKNNGTEWYYIEGSSLFVCKFWVCEQHAE
jgi:hypothetical protein